MPKQIVDKGNGIYEVTVVSDPVTIDTKALEAQVKELEKLLQAEEPSKKELEDWGKTIHPFYIVDKVNAETEIERINKLIEEVTNANNS